LKEKSNKREKYNRVKPLCPQEFVLRRAEEKDGVVKNEHVRWISKSRKQCWR